MPIRIAFAHRGDSVSITWPRKDARMAKHVSRRSAAIAAFVVILFIAAAAAPSAMAHISGWLSNHSSATSGARQAPAPHAPAHPSATSESPQGAGPASVQLVTQDLSPATPLHLTASGFLPTEQLIVTVEDAQGNPYEQVTLTAGKDGRLRGTSVAAPPQLASGTYKVLVVGSMSHRKASVTFRMHDIPPTVAFDAYTGAPGQTIGFIGSGFIPGEEVVIYLDKATTPLADAKATNIGAISGRLTVPALTASTYTLTIVGSVSQTPLSIGFSIQGFVPWVILGRYALTSGQGLGFTGQGFAPNEPVLVYLNGTTRSPALHVTADSSGRIVEQDTWMPSVASGRNVLTFVGQWSKTSAVAEFTVLPSAQPSPTATAP